MTVKAPSASRRPRRFHRLRTPLEEFLQSEASGGLLLILTSLLAMGWANSPWAELYRTLAHLPIALRVGDFTLQMSLVHWVNDVLMALFFFVVGLEIKRELLVGELAGWRRAALPAVAALGGMIVPALIYAAGNAGGPAAAGWGIPMATDIAFAIGILALLGARVPLALKVFLLALAIIDDLGAVLVIALFYTAGVHSGFLVLAAATWLLALGYGNFGGGRASVYVLLGALLWFFTYKSGIHATIAGVALAFTVPVAHRLDRGGLLAELRQKIGDRFEQIEMELGHAADRLLEGRSPLHRFEHALTPYVAYLVMPLFALMNAGVTVTGSDLPQLASGASLGVFLGLYLGKPAGVLLACWLAVRLRLAALPEGISFGCLSGAGFLAGIGFTMSLFIAALAFPEGSLLDGAKLVVLMASLAAAITGLAILHRSLPRSASRNVV